MFCRRTGVNSVAIYCKSNVIHKTKYVLILVYSINYLVPIITSIVKFKTRWLYVKYPLKFIYLWNVSMIKFIMEISYTMVKNH